MSLFEYQRFGVEWMLGRETASETPGGFLCDEMGMGKTVQLIETMRRNSLKNTLIVVPKSIVGQWASELARFAPEFHVHTFEAVS